MSDQQGLPVSGYRPQTVAAIDLVNNNKQLEERILRQIDHLRLDPSVDQRWLAIGLSKIEQGFMAINRSVFRPSRIGLPEDDDTVL